MKTLTILALLVVALSLGSATADSAPATAKKGQSIRRIWKYNYQILQFPKGNDIVGAVVGWDLVSTDKYQPIVYLIKKDRKEVVPLPVPEAKYGWKGEPFTAASPPQLLRKGKMLAVMMTNRSCTGIVGWDLSKKNPEPTKPDVFGDDVSPKPGTLGYEYFEACGGGDHPVLLQTDDPKIVIKGIGTWERPKPKKFHRSSWLDCWEDF